MKKHLLYFKTSLLLGVLMVACNGPQRDLYPKTLVGGFQLLDSETTGIDFNNAIKETESFNHFYCNSLNFRDFKTFNNICRHISFYPSYISFGYKLDLYGKAGPTGDNTIIIQYNVNDSTFPSFFCCSPLLPQIKD